MAGFNLVRVILREKCSWKKRNVQLRSPSISHIEDARGIITWLKKQQIIAQFNSSMFKSLLLCWDPPHKFTDPKATCNEFGPNCHRGAAWHCLADRLCILFTSTSHYSVYMSFSVSHGCNVLPFSFITRAGNTSCLAQRQISYSSATPMPLLVELHSLPISSSV